MELNARGRYAVMAMADIARHGASGAMPLSQIAERQKLPLPYLEQIFLQLRRAGLVESARGRAGGYRLTRQAAEIAAYDVMAAVEEETSFTRCAGEADGCVAGERCLTHELWEGLGEAASAYLKSVSLATIVGRKPSDDIARVPAAPRIYLDHNATAPLRAAARLAIDEANGVVGNASSVHSEGRRARALIERAREEVAGLVNARPAEVVFTSGATEANAHVLAQGWDTIFVSGIEHDSVLAPARASGARVIEIGANSLGVAHVEEVAAYVLSGAPLGRALVALQMANNETGVIQPVAELADFGHEHGLFMHVDAVQATGRLPVDFAALGVASLAISSHKLGGPKGVGALVIRDRVDLVPFVRGGGQERRRRGGTENVAGIAGFGAAAAEARYSIDKWPSVAILRDALEAGVRVCTPAAIVIGEGVPRLANTSCIALPGKAAETLVIKLDLAGFAVSAGAACSSGKVGGSQVLEAMGLGPEIAKGAIRVSLGPETTDHDIAAFLAAWETVAGRTALAA